MSAIDVHTHAFPDSLAKRAIKTLAAQGDWDAVGNGKVKGLVKSMDRADIDISVVCAIATKPGQTDAILDWCKQIRSDRIEAFPSVHPDTPDAADAVLRIVEEGFHGIKLHPMYQDFAADEPRMDPIYAAAQEAGLVVTFHCGRDIAFPEDDDRAAPARMRSVIDRYPNLQLLCTHMGGWEDWDDAFENLLDTGAYIETSFSLDRLPVEKARDMILRYGTDRVMYGSDWPWNDQGEEIARIRRLELDDNVTRAILWGNAARMLGY